MDDFKVLDGGLATELVRQGTHASQHAIDDDPLWSARLISTNPNAIKRVHSSFLEAGADVIESATYQASIDGFCEHHQVAREEAYQLLVKGARLAVEARDEVWRELQRNNSSRKKPLVAGDIGPYGAHLHDGSEYTGNYVDEVSAEKLKEFHRPRMQAQLEGGVDFLSFATIPAQREAEILVQLLKEFPSAKAWLAYSCKDAEHTSHGEKFSSAIQVALQSDQVFGIAINCTAPEFITPLLKSIQHQCGDKTVIVYPNSGEEWTAEHRWFGKESCRPLHDYVGEWIDAGAKWIGGCCRITPEDITLIRKAIAEKVASKGSGVLPCQ